MLHSKRLFLGLALPAEATQTLAALDPDLPGLRWLPPSQMHLTLSFLGDVDHASAERLRGALQTVKVPPFFLPIQGLGMFKARGRPSVVWAGVGQGHPHLFALHKHIQDAILQVNLKADLRPFHPHVTVARARDVSTGALQKFLRKQEESEFALVRVSGFTLYSSDLLAEGALHHSEAEFPF